MGEKSRIKDYGARIRKKKQLSKGIAKWRKAEGQVSS